MQKDEEQRDKELQLLTDKKRFIPVNNDCGELAVQSIDGFPS